MAARIDLRILEGVGIFLAARRRARPSGRATVATPAGGIDLFLGLADALAHPGEIDELHASLLDQMMQTRPQIVPAGVERQQRRRARAA